MCPQQIAWIYLRSSTGTSLSGSRREKRARIVRRVVKNREIRAKDLTTMGSQSGKLWAKEYSSRWQARSRERPKEQDVNFFSPLSLILSLSYTGFQESVCLWNVTSIDIEEKRGSRKIKKKKKKKKKRRRTRKLDFPYSEPVTYLFCKDASFVLIIKPLYADKESRRFVDYLLIPFCCIKKKEEINIFYLLHSYFTRSFNYRIIFVL